MVKLLETWLKESVNEQGLNILHHIRLEDLLLPNKMMLVNPILQFSKQWDMDPFKQLKDISSLVISPC